MSSSRSSSLNGYGSLDIRKSESRHGSLLVGGVSGSPVAAALPFVAGLGFSVAIVLDAWENGPIELEKSMSVETPFPLSRVSAGNVSMVPQRSPLRYPRKADAAGPVHQRFPPLPRRPVPLEF